jgi:hypothetical protein
MIKPAVLDALVAAGATAEMIVAAIRADVASPAGAKEKLDAEEKIAKIAASQRRAYLRRKERLANSPEPKP